METDVHVHVRPMSSITLYHLDATLHVRDMWVCAHVFFGNWKMVSKWFFLNSFCFQDVVSTAIQAITACFVGKEQHLSRRQPLNRCAGTCSDFVHAFRLSSKHFLGVSAR